MLFSCTEQQGQALPAWYGGHLCGRVEGMPIPRGNALCTQVNHAIILSFFTLTVLVTTIDALGHF